VGLTGLIQVRERSKGRVYFRTYTGADGIGPDETSYGFRVEAQRARDAVRQRY